MKNRNRSLSVLSDFLLRLPIDAFSQLWLETSGAMDHHDDVDRFSPCLCNLKSNFQSYRKRFMSKYTLTARRPVFPEKERTSINPNTDKMVQKKEGRLLNFNGQLPHWQKGGLGKNA